jgi:hypothetical protein
MISESVVMYHQSIVPLFVSFDGEPSFMAPVATVLAWHDCLFDSGMIQIGAIIDIDQSDCLF